MDHVPVLAVVARVTSEIDLAERMACAQRWDFPQDYREHGDHLSTCVTCGNVFRGNPARNECRVCVEGHHCLDDVK